jgi:hypothetical protein
MSCLFAQRAPSLTPAPSASQKARGEAVCPLRVLAADSLPFLVPLADAAKKASKKKPSPPKKVRTSDKYRIPQGRDRVPMPAQGEALRGSNVQPQVDAGNMTQKEGNMTQVS